MSCARRLSDDGAAVALVERSRGIGGRCATRRVEGQPVDHGVAFYHGSDPLFIAALRASGGDRVEGWPHRVAGAGNPCQPLSLRPGETRLAFADGMTTFPKRLAQGLDVRRDCNVAELGIGPHAFELTAVDGTLMRARQVVLAVTATRVAELLALLPAANPDLAAIRHLVDGVSLVPCLTVIAGYPRGGAQPEWDMLYPEDSRILQLVSHDSTKRREPLWTVLVLQALPCWSRLNHQRPAEDWRSDVLAEAARLCGAWAARPQWVQTHAWRHARIGGGGGLCGPLLVELGNGRRLGIAGEAFGAAGGAEAAWQSGRALARRLAGAKETA